MADAIIRTEALTIGLAGQYGAVDENLTGLENLELVARLYHLGKQEVRERGGQILERFGLSDAADRVVLLAIFVPLSIRLYRRLT